MHLYLVNPRGFCAGVKRAISTVEKALELFGRPIYVKHQIVHNQHVVKELETKGAVFIEDLKSVPKGGRIIYSAHGVSPDVRKEAKQRKLKEIDATCFLVTRSHAAAKKYAEKGFQIVLIGHKNHIEVIGIQKEAFDHTTVIESLADVQKLKFTSQDKIFYLTQTTLDVTKTACIIKTLKQSFSQAQTLPSSSICYATTSRQKALFSILDKVDLALIIGDPSSSNSNRLKEMAEQKTKAFLIHQDKEITEKILQNSKFIALTAGASTPEKIVQNCIERLKKLGVKTIEELNSLDQEEVFPLPQFIS